MCGVSRRHNPWINWYRVGQLQGWLYISRLGTLYMYCPLRTRTSGPEREIYFKNAVLRIRIQDPLPFRPSGSWITSHISESSVAIVWAKSTRILCQLVKFFSVPVKQ
jgi:hypothetical protein